MRFADGACRAFSVGAPPRLPLSTLAAIALRFVVAVCALVGGASLYYRTTNLWALKNLGDSFISKSIGARPIVVGAFHRQADEQNVAGAFAVIQFLGRTKDSHRLFCHSKNAADAPLVSRAHIQSISQAKRAASDVCAWGGFLAECEIASGSLSHVQVTTNKHALDTELIRVDIEAPLRPPTGAAKQKLVVCVAPLYVYTEWTIMLTGIETWLALGATKLIFPIQSASSDVLRILRAYEVKGLVTLRNWPKWPILSDVNPNGLVLSRGIEESHVNCLHYAKPFAELVAFTDIDDMLIPPDPLRAHPTANIDILESLFFEHPQAGSLIFEHRDVQFVSPSYGVNGSTLRAFNFNFLRVSGGGGRQSERRASARGVFQQTQWKQNCNVWRMKTRVVVNASRVDTINMHETGVQRLGYVQVRVPCGRAHFYHLRHSYKAAGLNEWAVDTSTLTAMLNRQWATRLSGGTFARLATRSLPALSNEQFEDFDRCVSLITDEHFTLKVSRCMTPHVCFSRVKRNISCVATAANYAFAHSAGDFTIVLRNSRLVDSETNCEAPLPRYESGNYFYLP